MTRSFIEGNEAVGWGALAAGCDFFAGYPITPATTVFNTMLSLLPPRGGICLQGEDEIASIGFCLGASMAGHKAMTATSGPGLSLYSEQISFALGSEIPLVIVNVQRLGPSTGSATKGADGDIQFMRWGQSSGLPVIVLAPSDAADCYLLTYIAFNLAEVYRCPVFVAANKEVSMTREAVDLEAISLPPLKERRQAPLDRPFLPFAVPEDRLTPDFLPLGGGIPVRQTSSTHGPDGYITTDPGQIERNQERLKAKLEQEVESFTYSAQIGPSSGRTLVLSYGVTSRAARDAVQALNQDHGPVGLLDVKTLWPVPEGLIRDRAQGFEEVLVVEMNLGQYVREIQRILPDKPVRFLGQMNGELIKPQRIRQEVLHG